MPAPGGNRTIPTTAFLLLSVCLVGLSQGCGFGIDPFAKALRDKNTQAVHRESKAIVDPNYVVQYGTAWYYAPLPILVVAASEGNVEGVKYLLDKGADVNAAVQDTSFRYWPGGMTALHAAANIGHVGIVQMLIARGANPNAKVRTMFGAPDARELQKLRGLTPLMVAAIRGKEDAVQALLDGGASPAERELTKGQTARELAQGRGLLQTALLIELAELNHLPAQKARLHPAAHAHLNMPTQGHWSIPR